jgi:hypothetical protein
MSIPYIVITSEINHHNLPLSDTSDYWLLKSHLHRDESPQKSSLYVKTLPKENLFSSLNQTIWSQYD